MERTEERISELENRKIQITQAEGQRENRLTTNKETSKHKNTRALRTCGTVTKNRIFMSSESQKKKRKKSSGA